VMGFDKKTYEHEIQIAVTHQWHPGKEFVFTFPKTLPQPALDAEKAFLGVEEKEREALSRILLIKTVAAMVTREPEGFDNFPPSAVKNDLAERFIVYFDDPSQPELEAITTSAFSGYKAAARPVAYLKSLQSDGARDDQPSGATKKASPKL
jgi:hypothetical protein